MSNAYAPLLSGFFSITLPRKLKETALRLIGEAVK